MSETNQVVNIFAMFQKNSNCHYPTVRIDFTPIKDSSQSIAKGENVFKKIIPSYNNDGLYFTDAFILESDSIKKSNPQANSFESLPNEDDRYKFESKVQKENASMEIQVPAFLIQEIYQAEPDSFFCQICRAPFENYIEHIEGRDHVRNLQFSKGHKFIKQICKQAKKYFLSDETDKLSTTSVNKQKNKPISQKKGDLRNPKKNQKSQRKTTKKSNMFENDVLQESKEKQSEDLRSKENEELVSIIKGQMKLSAVENQLKKIQNID